MVPLITVMNSSYKFIHVSTKIGKFLRNLSYISNGHSIRFDSETTVLALYSIEVLFDAFAGSANQITPH